MRIKIFMPFFVLLFTLFSCSAILKSLPPEEDADGESEVIEAFDWEAEGAKCGDGIVEEGEECDDGNTDNTDGCKADCTFSCHSERDCDDENVCNGQEICSQEHTCVEGSPLGEGTVCGYNPRQICIGGECQQSFCGDGFIDTGAGESCDPPGEKCSQECHKLCTENADCEDDGNICNGEEYCIISIGECASRNPLPDGTLCGGDSRQICIHDSCQESMCGDGYADPVANEECDDGKNPDNSDGCTQDCLFSCHGDADCDDGHGCTEDICIEITSGKLCYSRRSMAGTPCRLVAGPCDVAEVCDGNSDDCPSDSYQGRNVLCRDSAGVCDAPDYCPGNVSECPDLKYDNSITCRAASGICDIEEKCDGINNDCPVDTFKNGETCRASTNTTCDPPETCNGSSASCPPDVNNCVCDGNEDCPSDGNPCNGQEYCDTSSGKCSVRNVPSDGTVCGVEPQRKICLNQVCVVSICGDGFADSGRGEECDDGNSISGDGCEPVTCLYSCHSDTDCPEDGHLCTREYCDASETHKCLIQPISGNVCRHSAGDCDVEERCDGVNPDCPPDAFAPSSRICRESTDRCDPAEYCSGTSPYCPPDFWRCWLTVDGGLSHTCGIKTNNKLYCWGENDDGQLGNGSTVDSNIPVLVGNGEVLWNKVSAGGFHSCAISENGALYCWGKNSSGQIGDGTNTRRLLPVQIGTDTDWEEISTGGEHTCGIKDNRAYCWGNNNYGQLGLGNNTSYNTPQEVRGGLSGQNIIMISCGMSHTCALTGNKEVYCWGLNLSGQLGVGDTTNRNSPVRVSRSTISAQWIYIATGSLHSCGITEGLLNTLYCWGENGNHQIGDGTTDDRNSPTLVIFSAAEIQGQIAGVEGGSSHTCSWSSSQELFCWGGNNFGQIGDGTGGEKSFPVEITSINVSFASTGGFHTCAINNLLELYCWGRNDSGQVGDGTNSRRLTPVRVY